jgi:hypothetical protein
MNALNALNALNATFLAEMRARASLERVLEWLSLSPPESTSIDSRNSSSLASPPTGYMRNCNPKATAVGSCKACNERNAICDGQRPRCSTCLHEQLMCFYIGGRHCGRRQQR